MPSESPEIAKYCITCINFELDPDDSPCARCMSETMNNEDQSKRRPHWSLKRIAITERIRA